MELQTILLISVFALLRGVRSHGPPVHYAPKSSVVNNSETSTPAPASPAIVFPSTGQLIAMYGVAQVAATRFRSLSSEVIKEDTGTFIRTAYRDGCVDAGCCMGIRKHVRFNNDCPSWGWLKWSFNGPMLVAHRPFFHSCLECEKGDKNCLIISSACRGKHSQFWHLNGTLGLKNSRGEDLFTIVNDLHPERCVTVDEDTFELYLKPCANPEDTQLFYMTKNWIEKVKGSH